MRLGTIMRLVRLANQTSAQSFADLIDLPRPTVSALEGGWLPPRPDIVDRLFRYLPAPTGRTLYPLLVGQFLREYSLRFYADYGSAFPLCFSAGAALQAVIPYVPPGQNFGFPEREIESHSLRLFATLEGALKNDSFSYQRKMAELPFDLRLDLLRWLLSQKPVFIPPKDAWRTPLNKPSKRLEKLLGLLPPALGRGFYSFSQLHDLLTKDPPKYVPEPLLSLDLLLLLALEVNANPLDPGKATVILPLPERILKIEVYYPPQPFAFPGIDYGNPYIRQVETPSS